MCRKNPTQDERYALKICIKLLGYTEDLRLSDKPDLQDDKNSIGIEVRNVMDKSDGIAKAYIDKYFTGNLPKVEKDKGLIKMHVKGKIIDLGFCHIFVADKVNGDFEAKLECFINSFEDKIKKINGGYRIFKQNNLFLFCDNFEKRDIDKALSKLKEKDYSSFKI